MLPEEDRIRHARGLHRAYQHLVGITWARNIPGGEQEVREAYKQFVEREGMLDGDDTARHWGKIAELSKKYG